MSLYEIRPTLIDSNTSLVASVEPCADDGVVVFLRMQNGNEETHVMRVSALNFTLFATAISQIARQFEEPAPAQEKKPRKRKAPKAAS